MSASQSAPSGLQNIKNQLGYLIVDMDENILESSGDLSNDGKAASIVVDMIRLVKKYLTLSCGETYDHFKRISIQSGDIVFQITVSSGKIFISKQSSH